jgi:hypothetical protein
MADVTNPFQYTFFGKVHPERCNVSIPEVRAEVRLGMDQVDGVLRYYISLSQVTATFIADNPIANIHTLKNVVEDAVRIALDALGYTLACGYDLEIIQVIDSIENPPVVFGVGIPAIERSASDAGVTFQTILSVFGDPKGQYLQRCLSNLREAIRAPKDTGFFCYRGIENLRDFFVQEKRAKDKNASWELLRTELSVVRADLDLIKGFADPIRHGGGGTISDQERANVFTLTWGIVNSFIKYANAGYKSAVSPANP